MGLNLYLLAMVAKSVSLSKGRNCEHDASPHRCVVDMLISNVIADSYSGAD